MRKTLHLAGLLLAIGAVASPTVDLTPQPKTIKIEGTSVNLIQFRSSEEDVRSKPVEYRPPWPISGSTNKAVMYIPDRDACASVRRVDTDKPLDLNDDDAVTAWINGALATGADNLKIESIEKNPLKLNGKPTVEVTLTYGFYGRTLRHSLLLAERFGPENREVIIFELQSAPPDFEKLHRLFQVSLYSVTGF